MALTSTNSLDYALTAPKGIQNTPVTPVQNVKPTTSVAPVQTSTSGIKAVNGLINGVPVAEYNRLDNFYKTPTATPSPSVGSTINSANTQTPPAVNLPSTNVPTQGATLSSDINTQAQNYANSIVNANELATSKTNLDTTAKSIADYISGRSGETALKDAEYQANVDPAKQELNDITNQLNQETLAGRRRIEAVLNIPGITKEQAQDKINEIDRVNVSKQADLAIIFQAKNGAYETAKEIADRKVSAFLEVEKNKLDALQFTYTNNKELFNKQEQRQFETAQAERTRLLNEKSTELKAINDLAINALQNGASTSVVQKMQNAKTQAEAISFGGQFVGAQERELKKSQIEQNKAQTNKLRADTQKIIDENNAKLSPATKELSLATAQSNIQAVDSLAKNKAIAGAVGPSFLGRGFFGGGTFSKLAGEEQNFIAGVEQMRSQLTLDNLVNAKARGATFAALAVAELNLLAQSASKIGKWAKTDKDGNTIGYNASEKDFKAELDKINNFSKLDYVLKGGNPSDVGVQITDDGHLWSINSNGSYTQLK